MVTDGAVLVTVGSAEQRLRLLAVAQVEDVGPVGNELLFGDVAVAWNQGGGGGGRKNIRNGADC